MVDSDAYAKFIKKLINEYSSQLKGTKAISEIANLHKWSKEYSTQMQNRDDYNKIIYIKVGVNIISRLIDEMNEETSKFNDYLIKCRMSLLKDEGTCSERTKEDLINLIKKYNLFTQAIIGCADDGTMMILQLLKRDAVSRALGDDYSKAIAKIKGECMDLRVKMLRM